MAVPAASSRQALGNIISNHKACTFQEPFIVKDVSSLRITSQQAIKLIKELEDGFSITLSSTVKQNTTHSLPFLHHLL